MEPEPRRLLFPSLFVLPLVLAWAASAQAAPSDPLRAALQDPAASLGRSLGSAALELVGRARVAESIPDLNRARAQATELLASAAKSMAPGALEFDAMYAVEVAGVFHLEYQQLLGGYPVLGSRLELELTRGGECTRLVLRGWLAPAHIAPFALDRVRAFEHARAALESGERARLWLGSSARLVLPATLAEEPRPAWRLELFDPLDPAASWIALVDGADGRVHRLESAVLEGISGTLDGRGIASGPQTTSAPVALPIANAYVSAFEGEAALTRVTDNGCGDTQVAISADGSTIAWASDCDGEIWIAARDGGGAHALTSDPAKDHSPALSADGSRVVFVSDRDGDEELFAVASDGSGLVQLTVNVVADHSPALSADGERVVYVSGLGGEREIFTLLVSAPVAVQRTTNTTADHSPAIALDGSRIAWVAEELGDSEIFTAPFAGGVPLALTVNAVTDLEPDVAPDGSRVVFASRLALEKQGEGDPGASSGLGRNRRTASLRYDLFEATSDGSALQRLTSTDADEREPAYAAGGGAIAYAVDSGAGFDIELLDLASGFALRLTEDAFDDRAPRVAASMATGAWIRTDGDTEVFTWDLGAGSAALSVSDEVGAYSLDFPDGRSPSVSARLRGPFTCVHDLDPRWGDLYETASVVTPDPAADLVFNPTGSEEGPTGQVTAWVHANRGHDGLAMVLLRPPLSMPAPLPIDAQLDLRTQLPTPTANAFYNPERKEATFFIGDGPLRPNTAYDTVVLHEYGHYFDDQMGGIGSGSACEAEHSLSEGTADSVALLLSASPVIGADFFGPGTWMRNYAVFPWEATGGARGRQYGCEGCKKKGGKPEPHDHGEAFAGVAWELLAMVGYPAAEDLVFGALAGNPGDMPGAVGALFALAATPAFGGSGDPTSSPYADELYTVAAMHGFDGPTRADFGSRGCFLGECIPTARHRVIGSEWLGVLVLPETTCEPPFSPEDDGVTVPPHWGKGTKVPLSFALSVNPALQDSGRYGAPTPVKQVAKRRVYLNAWLLIDDGAGGFDKVKVLGTGSGSGVLGPDSFESGVDAVAFNPDTWGGSTTTFDCELAVPELEVSRPAILRVRLDYGEDAGRLKSCLSDASLDQECGQARFGEVEDYQVMILAD